MTIFILDGWEDRYKYLIELGGQLPRFSDEQKKDEWKVPGCQSQVWIIPHYSENGISFEGDSDAIIVRGIIAVVLEIFKDKSAQEILDIDVEEIFDKMGLREHITPNRRSGMLSMVDKIKYYAAQALKGQNEYSRISGKKIFKKAGINVPYGLVAYTPRKPKVQQKRYQSSVPGLLKRKFRPVPVM